MALTDAVVHGWDLAVATGQDATIDDRVAGPLLAGVSLTAERSITGIEATGQGTRQVFPRRDCRGQRGPVGRNRPGPSGLAKVVGDRRLKPCHPCDGLASAAAQTLGDDFRESSCAAVVH
jgi:hypothetical protein